MSRLSRVYPFLFIMLAISPTAVFSQAESPPQSLNEVVVSAERLQGPSVDRDVLGGRVEVIGPEQIRKESSRTVAEFLGSLPGFTLRDQGGNEFDQVLSARGFSKGEDVLLTVDGIRMNKFGNNGIDWQALPDLSAIERIEVIYGPGSSVYGEGARSAVVNLITKKDQQQRSIQYTGGSFAHNEGKFSGGFRLHGWDGFIQGRAVDRNGFRINSDANIQNALINLTRPLATGGELRVQGMLNRSKVGAPNAITDTEIRRNGYEFTDPANRDDFREVDHDAFKLSYEGTVFGLTGIEFQYSHQDRESNFETTSRVFGSKSVVNAEQTVDGIQLVLRDTQPLAGFIHHWSGGFEFNDTEQDRKSFGGRDEKQTRSFFLQDRVFVSDRLTLTGGIRFDNTDMFLRNNNNGATFHRNFDPENVRAGMTYRLDSQWTLFGQYGESFMPPNFADILAFDGPFLSNPEIKPEESEQWEVGIRGGGPDYELTINYFRIDTDNEIRLNTTSSTTPINENLAETRREGFELNGTYQPTDRLTLSGMITRFDATISSNPSAPETVGKTVPMVPDYRASWTVDYSFSNSLNASLRGLYVDDQFVFSDNDNNQPPLTSYDLWNLSATWNFSPSGSLQLSVKNLLDDNFSTRAVESGSSFGFFPPGTTFFSPAPDRHGEVTLNWRF